MNPHAFQQIFNDIISKSSVKRYHKTKYIDSQTAGFITTGTFLVTHAIIMSFHDVTVKIGFC